jgi:hypothetical protein
MEALRPFETSGVAHPRPRRQAARIQKLLEEPRLISGCRRCVHAVVTLLRCYSAWIRSYYRRFEADYWSFKDRTDRLPRNEPPTNISEERRPGFNDIPRQSLRLKVLLWLSL